MRARIEELAADLVVVGTGIAGLACALASPGRVLLVTKTALAESGSSYWAQGGIAAALDPEDDPKLHGQDTLAAGAGLCDPERVAGLVAEAPDVVAALEDLGVPFDRDADGRLRLGREGAHGLARIAHAAGDGTGRAICAALIRAAWACPRITLLTRCFAWDLLVEGGAVRGLLAYDDAHGWRLLRAGRVVLATGGIGALFAGTTNPPEATGDGLAIAARAGVPLADLEFVQFHPTALDAAPADGTALPLLSEALRGEGARLVDAAGEPLPTLDHPAGDLASRDIVARAIWRHHAAGGRVHLDLRPVLGRLGIDAFPNAVAACRAAGLDPLAAPVPVTPAAHYHMGGVVTDAQGRTALPGLWACGETAATGVHGANRLASNSLLEAFVFGRRVAADAASMTTAGSRLLRATVPPELPDMARLAQLRPQLRTVAGRWLGLVRDGAGLAAAGAAFAAIEAATAAAAPMPLGPGRLAEVRAFGELRNLTLVARLLAHAAALREESRGAHFRRDFPTARGEWHRRLVLTAADLGEQCHARVALAS